MEGRKAACDRFSVPIDVPFDPAITQPVPYVRIFTLSDGWQVQPDAD